MHSKQPVVNSKKSKRLQNAIGAGVIGLAAVCVVATAVLIATRESPPADMTAAETSPQAAEATKSSPKKGPAPQAQAKKTAAAKPPAVSVVPPRTLTASPMAAKTPAVQSKAKAPEVIAKAPAAEPKANAPELMAKAPAAEPAGVTITGCLERDNDRFRLRDTTGGDAPKGRSWKSGFLKKGSASIQIVDAANRLKLANHIGQRVSVTGMLLDREMQARLLQRVGTPCDRRPA
jgi:cytoskeletal protein RodZ